MIGHALEAIGAVWAAGWVVVGFARLLRWGPFRPAPPAPDPAGPIVDDYMRYDWPVAELERRLDRHYGLPER